MQLSPYQQNVLFMLAGLLAGKVVNWCTNLATTPLRGRTSYLARLLRLLIEVAIVAAVPIALTKFGEASFVQTWQVTIPGLLFASCFLASQQGLVTI